MSLIARRDISDIIVPEFVIEEANKCVGAGIDVSSVDTKWPEPRWVYCRKALPHVDTDLSNVFLLTLVIQSSHRFSDAFMNSARGAKPRLQEIRVYPCDIFVVDPRSCHWLFNLGAELEGKESPPWIALQWELSRKRAARQARAVIDHIGATWVDCNDKRYSKWKPEELR